MLIYKISTIELKIAISSFKKKDKKKCKKHQRLTKLCRSNLNTIRILYVVDLIIY